MLRTALAAVVLWCAASSAHAQQVDPALTTAIDQVCAPFVLDAVAEANIAPLQGITPVVNRYRLGPGLYVRFTQLGPVRVCSVLVDEGDVGAYRAEIMEAASRWPNPLTYGGDIPHGIGFTRSEKFCPGESGPRTSWTLMSRDSGTLLTLATMSAATRHCTAEH